MANLRATVCALRLCKHFWFCVAHWYVAHWFESLIGTGLQVMNIECKSLQCLELIRSILQQNISIIEFFINNNKLNCSRKIDIYHNLIEIENFLVFFLYKVTKFSPTLKPEIELALTSVYKYRIRYSKYCA